MRPHPSPTHRAACLALALCLSACGGARGYSSGGDDASSRDDASTQDLGGLDAGLVTPPDDLGRPPADTGNVTPPADTGNVTPPTDTGNVTPPADTGNVTPPTDTGNVTPPADTGNVTPLDAGTMPAICPSSCTTSTACEPCRGPSDPPGSNYCCVSGLCLYMQGVCGSVPTDVALPTDLSADVGDLGL
ncbi:MAG: hypothetical protein JNK72_06180 [Myxococcales bacterium]|nr:hypothetical protein [Myxococcales bacterium]